MEINFCKNHPDQIAHMRCYECKKPVCAECRQMWSHHYFCSRWCYFRFAIKSFADFFIRRKKAIFALWQILIIALLFLQFFYIQQQHRAISALAPDAKDEDTTTALANVQKSPVLSFEKKNLGIQVENRYRLNLSIKPGYVVNVWINGQPFISRIVSNSDNNDIEVPMQYGKNHLRVLVLDGKQKIIYADEAILDVHNYFLKNMSRSVEIGRTKANLIAFTFDGGSDDLHSQEILKILRDYKVHCTLFLTGKFMLRHPGLVKQMIADGHEIGNHMFSHPHLTTYTTDRPQSTLAGVTREFVQQELLKTDSIFYKISGKHLQPFWRAPFGEYNQEILGWAAEIGYRHIRWTSGFDTYDWVTDESSKLFRTPGEIYSQFSQKQVVRSRGLKGVIVLMHLGSHRNNNHVYQVLPRLIEWIRGQNYQLATITELLSSSRN